MPFRFFRRIRIAPGVTLNLSKGGASISVGPRGAKFTVGTSGTRATAGLPGTGLHYTVVNPHKNLASGSRRQSRSSSDNARAPAPAKLSWLKRLSMPKSEQAFVQGWQAWSEEQVNRALDLFLSVPSDAAPGADAAWSAAVIYTQQEQFGLAANLLEGALQTPQRIGSTFAEHGLMPTLYVDVAPDVEASMSPTAYSARLLLSELQQSQGESAQALKTLQPLLPRSPDAGADPVVLAAFGELAIEVNDVEAQQRFLTLAAALANDTPVHTVVMYYRAQALVNQSLANAALEVLTPALRRTKDRSQELLLNIRHLRAQVYQTLGRKARARADLERIYAADPGFEGVAEALGVK